MIQNPILCGFYPDPSICRVGGDYYIASSTFEWWPGVQLHHSRDLQNWRHVGAALDRPSQLDLRGCKNSGGVWAPCLTYAEGQFWLLYTNVRHHGAGIVLDTHNYLVTAENIEGPWSDPIYLNSSGFDPSLFHHESGRKYVVQMQTGEAGTACRFDGIWLQEYAHEERALIGKPIQIWAGTEHGFTEGPHLVRRGDWYYLITAEGGTSLGHCVSVARSRSLTGPFELHPENPILTTCGDEAASIQSTGHGCFVDTTTDEWYMAHLCNRPLQRPGCSVVDGESNKSVPLGRETAIQKICWDADAWPRLAHGGRRPAMEVEVDLPLHLWPSQPQPSSFSGPHVPSEFNTLREPSDAGWLSFLRRKGAVSLRGRDSLASCFDQSLIARRLQHFEASAETRLYFQPENFKQAAGLIAYYDRFHYHYFRLIGAGSGRAKLGIYISEGSEVSRVEVAEFDLLDLQGGLRLRMEMRGVKLFFAWSLGDTWNEVGTEFDATVCGDWVSSEGGFTGTFWGMCCQDLSCRSAWADFDFFNYQSLDPVEATERESEKNVL